jgi:hypothetical protein
MPVIGCRLYIQVSFSFTGICSSGYSGQSLMSFTVRRVSAFIVNRFYRDPFVHDCISWGLSLVCARSLRDKGYEGMQYFQENLKYLDGCLGGSDNSFPYSVLQSPSTRENCPEQLGQMSARNRYWLKIPSISGCLFSLS